MIVEVLSAGAIGTAATWAIGAYAPNSRLFGPVIGHGPTTSRSLYLTFDDGPSSSATPEILDTLARCAVPATFFLVGAHVRHSPDIARAIHAAGHEIGNHTDSHTKLHFRGPRTSADELRRAHQTIVDVVGQPPRLFRAPHGYKSPFVARAARELGYRMVGWTFGVWDSDCPGTDVIRRRVAAKVRSGAILLLHDGDGYDPHGDRSQTAAALQGIITDARDRGYQFRPLAELLA